MSWSDRARRFIPKVSVVLGINLVLLAFLFVGFGREYLRNLEIDREIAALEAEKQNLETQHLESLALIRDLSSEYYLEKEAREKRGLGNPGEKMIIVNTGEGEAPQPEVLGVATDESVSNPTRWWYYFFDPSRFKEMREL